jgi:hypothetical protein
MDPRHLQAMMNPTGASHAALRSARDVDPSQLNQQLLAPFEHRAFAREYASENPFRALGLIGGIPAYQAAKGMGLMGSRTGASQPFDQMMQGFTGLGEGWLQALRGKRSEDDEDESMQAVFKFLQGLDF